MQILASTRQMRELDRIAIQERGIPSLDLMERAAQAAERARAALEAGLTPDAVLTDAEEAQRALGEVTGRTVREGQSITLTVSLGTKYITVPDLTNYLQTDAERLLREQGVSVLVTQAVEPSVATGSVIRTDPAAGNQVAAGTTVIVYVSRPQVNTSTRVPALEGMDVNDARTLLVQNRLGLGSQTEQYSDTPPGTVLSQSPKAGSSVKLNSRINVVVSAGPEPAPEPEIPTTPEDWWSSLFGGGDSSSPAESGGEQTAPSIPGLSDWWASLVG